MKKWEVIAAPGRSWEYLLDHATLELPGVLDHNPPSSSDSLTLTHLKAQDRKWILSSILLLSHTMIIRIEGGLSKAIERLSHEVTNIFLSMTKMQT